MSVSACELESLILAALGLEGRPWRRVSVSIDRERPPEVQVFEVIDRGSGSPRTEQQQQTQQQQPQPVAAKKKRRAAKKNTKPKQQASAQGVILRHA